LGPTGFDSKMNGYVSMPGVVDVARKTEFSTVLNGENNYALAA
jgi:hypothetical protein